MLGTGYAGTYVRGTRYAGYPGWGIYLYPGPQLLIFTPGPQLPPPFGGLRPVETGAPIALAYWLSGGGSYNKARRRYYN
jgi:hypothetical protein